MCQISLLFGQFSVHINGSQYIRPQKRREENKTMLFCTDCNLQVDNHHDLDFHKASKGYRTAVRINCETCHETFFSFKISNTFLCFSFFDTTRCYQKSEKSTDLKHDEKKENDIVLVFENCIS